MRLSNLPAVILALLAVATTATARPASNLIANKATLHADPKPTPPDVPLTLEPSVSEGMIRARGAMY